MTPRSIRKHTVYIRKKLLYTQYYVKKNVHDNKGITAQVIRKTEEKEELIFASVYSPIRRTGMQFLSALNCEIISFPKGFKARHFGVEGKMWRRMKFAC